MKINYYQLFDVIDEYSVGMLMDTEITNDSYETTICDVKKLISSSTITVRKKTSRKLFILLAAVLVLMVGGLSFALNGRRAELIDESNGHLIGKTEMGTISIFDRYGNLRYGKPLDKNYDNIWKTSSIIKKVEVGISPPKSITEFKTIYESGKYITPEVMFNNGDFIIFTKENGDGWELEKGDSIIVSVNEYESEVNDGVGQSIVYFQIINGTFYKDSIFHSKTLEQKFELIAEKSGEYFICFGCNSSDRISLKTGEISIKKSSNK